MVLPMVPEGRNSAACFAGISAARSSSCSDRGIFAINVVADLGLRHGAPHGGGGLGYGIASQIDHARQSYELGKHFVRKQDAARCQAQDVSIGFKQPVYETASRSPTGKADQSPVDTPR